MRLTLSLLSLPSSQSTLVRWLTVIVARLTSGQVGRRSLLLLTFRKSGAHGWTSLIRDSQHVLDFASWWHVLLHRGEAVHVDLIRADSVQNAQLRTTLVAVFVYIFTAFYSIGEGPVP